MMTQQLEVSILAAPLAAIDRRALPQSWYDALRYARSDARAESTPRRGSRAVRLGVCGRPGDPARADRRSIPQSVSRIDFSLRFAPASEGAESASHRASTRTSLARRIECTFSDPKSRVRRATFSLGRGNVRVHVVLQTKGDRAVLLALCPPEVRGVVSRALAQARFALAARGIGVTLRAGAGRCS